MLLDLSLPHDLDFERKGKQVSASCWFVVAQVQL